MYNYWKNIQNSHKEGLHSFMYCYRLCKDITWNILGDINNNEITWSWPERSHSGWTTTYKIVNKTLIFKKFCGWTRLDPCGISGETLENFDHYWLLFDCSETAALKDISLTRRRAASWSDEITRGMPQRNPWPHEVCWQTYLKSATYVYIGLMVLKHRFGIFKIKSIHMALAHCYQ